jgi:predicted transcriptional regulator
MSTYVVYPTEEQEKAFTAFLKALEVSFVKEDDETLPDYVIRGIAEGQKDIDEGRFITLDEFKKRIASK